MLSIKEYAERQGVTQQAIYQSLKSQDNKDKLNGHIFLKDGKKWLDDAAVEILDNARKKNPVVIVQEKESERVADLEQQVHNLKDAIIELQDKLMRKQEIIENTQNKLIQAKESESLLIQREHDITFLNKQIDTLAEQLEQEKRKSWIDKLFKR